MKEFYDIADLSSEEIVELLQEAGGLSEGVSREISRKTGVPEADIYGVASFYHLLAKPSTLRVL